jgi:hypothetical protein
MLEFGPSYDEVEGTKIVIVILIHGSFCVQEVLLERSKRYW